MSNRNSSKEHIDDKILRLFRESTNKNKDKICPKNITLSDLEKAMGASKDAQVHIKVGNKQSLWEAYYMIMLRHIDIKLPDISNQPPLKNIRTTTINFNLLGSPTSPPPSPSSAAPSSSEPSSS
jgi:hypothetical protein